MAINRQVSIVWKKSIKTCPIMRTPVRVLLVLLCYSIGIRLVNYFFVRPLLGILSDFVARPGTGGVKRQCMPRPANTARVIAWREVRLQDKDRGLVAYSVFKEQSHPLNLRL